MKVKYGVTRMGNSTTNGYYIVEWDCNVYTAQDYTVMKGYILSEYAYADKLVRKVRFWNLVKKVKYYHTAILEGEGDTPLRMKKNIDGRYKVRRDFGK